ncbi:hypothetical protein ABE905_13715 [Enterococcus durans]|uniref:hypothetical protein n=1 Tax=Enterococcus durans TaxID=53345 RepID=UPI003D6C0B75
MKMNFNKLGILMVGLIPLSTSTAVLADTTELTANFESNYILNIPSNQTITEKNVNIGDLYVTGDIAPNQAVKVATEVKQFERVGSNDVLPFTLKYNQSTDELTDYSFAETDILSGSETKLDLWSDIKDDDWSNAKAGEYKGSIVFTAELKEQ